MNQTKKLEILNECILRFKITCERQYLIDYVKNMGVDLKQNNLFSRLRKVGVIQVIRKGTRSQNGLYKFSGEPVRIQYLGDSNLKVSQQSSNTTNKVIINEEYCIKYLKKRGFMIIKKF